MKKTFYLYILASANHKVMYVGITSNIVKRIYDHKLSSIPGFTRKYNVKKLLYFESSEDMFTILNRERKIKRWKRSWKEELIRIINPRMEDLFYKIK